MRKFLLSTGRMGLFALLFLAGLGLSAQTEIAVNGSFETGDFTDWDLFPSSAGQQTVGMFDATDGSFAANVVNDVEASASVIKNANIGIGLVNPGDEITITFDARGSAVNGGVVFAEFFSEISGGGTSASEILGGGPLALNADPNVWTSYSFTTTAGPDVSEGVTFQINAATGAVTGSMVDVFLDNLSVAVGGGTPPQNVTITFEVAASNITVSPEGLFIAGGGNFGNPGDNPLTDPDGDGIYTATFTRPAGFSSFYTFTNGACPDYSCKENIAGQDCADPNNFNDRSFPGVTQDTVISTCFEQCTDVAVCAPPTGANVEFCVDVSCVDDVQFVNIFGNNGFPGGDFNGDPNVNQLTDTGAGIYCITLFMNTGDTEYKFFVNGNNFEEFAPGTPGTVTNFGFTNRVITVEDGVDQNVLFGFNNGGGEECGAPGADVEFCVDIGCIMPTGTVNVFGIFPTSFFDPFQNEMLDPDGDGVYCTTVFLNPGTTEFKFIINPGAGADEINEMFSEGDPETVTNFGFTNRIIEVEDGVDQTTSYVFNVPGMGTYTEPVAEFPAIEVQCGNGETVTITGNATPAGGVYSGDGVTDNGDGTFDIDLPETGGVDVTYTFTDDLECVAEATVTIEVDNAAPVLICPGGAVGNALVNGSFEDGDFTGWTAIDNPNPFVAWAVGAQSNTGQDFFAAANPTDGAFLASNGFDGDAGEASLFQTVTVPERATLTWDENIDYDLTFGATMARIHMVEIQDMGGNTLETVHEIMAMAGTTDNDNAWESYAADLSAYAGQTVQVVFKQTIPENFTGPARFAVDNVVLSAEPLTVVLDDNGEFDVTTLDFVAEDACGIESTTIDPEVLTCENIGLATVAFSATDVNGLTTETECAFIVEFEQPNLACRGEINLTLNDECQGLVIPSMVLTGNTACIDVFDFDIVVQDSDPSNGPIIDGCGEFVYTISQRGDVAGPATLGFTGAYAPDQWFSAPFGAGGLFNNNTDEQIVTIDHTATTLEMTTLATVFSTGSQFGAQSSIQFGEMATVSFDYDFNGVDAFFDQAFSLTTFEGEIVDIGFNTITEEGGNVSFDVQPGYELIIQLRDDGFQPFAGPAPSVLTITGFEVAPMAADNPLDLDFESCWGIVRAEDKTPPAVVNQIAPIDLLCVDLDENRVDLLPNSVDRCYEVFSATGLTVPGTMATALRNALSAEVGNSAAIVPTFTDGCTERLEVCVTESIAFDAEDPQCNDVVLTRTFTATEIAVCPSASGESNGSTVSSYVITFSRPSLDDLDADNIEDVAEYDQCGVTTGTIAEIMASYPAPRATDFPFLVVGDRSFPLMDGEAVCNIGVTFADGQPIITCPNTYKFVRTYTVIDWCDPSDVRTFTQVVKVGDTQAPTFSGPTQDRDFDGVIDDDLIFSTNAGNQCAAYIVLDGPGVAAVDNCEGAITITAHIYPGGDLTASPIGPFVVDLTDGNAEVTSPIPVGTHLLRYTYEDVCGNADFSDFEFTVEDGTAPVAICEDGLNISITSGQTQGGGASTGIAILTPEMIDAGSYDDCSGITLEIARVNGNNVATEAYDQELVLTCADLGTVRVGLKVTDAEGNMNFCWLDVLVEDKNAPTCLPPGPVALTCVEYLAAGLPADINEASEDELNALFGSAVGIDNCEVTISSTVSGGVNSCGVGSLMRSFVATDGEGFVDDDNCEQFIDIRGVFDYRITFPTDEVFDECVDPDFNQLGAEEFACDLITTNVTMDTIAAVNAPDACYTLRVNYDVINFCEYNQLGECYRIPRDGDGIRNPDTQLLYLNVIPNNTANTGDDIAFLSRFTDRNYNPGAPQRDQLVDDGDDNDGSDDDNSNDSEEQQAANGVGFAYAQDNSRGYFCYVQFVDVYDEVAPTIEGDEPEECFAGTSADCTAEVELTFTADDNCTTPVVTVELDADYNVNAGFIPVNPASAGVSVSVSNDGINYTVNASNVPVGNHAIRIRANDGCGNFDSEIIEFCVEGDKAPTPICIQTLTVTLMPDGNGGGMAEIWASDFIASDVEDCFGNVIDKYSIYTEEEAGAAGFEPQVGDLGLDFTCDDYNGLGEDNTVPVRVYAIADNGSADYCSVIVDVQAFQEGVCGDGGGGGNLAGTILTQDDEAVAGVEVSLTGAGNMDQMAMTTANGSFSFTGLPLGEDYTVQPNYNVGVNLSNVTVADVNLMGNVILGIDQFATPYDYLAADVDRDMSLSVGDMVTAQRVILGLEDNFAISNWGFVPADVDVSNPYAEAFPGVYNLNDLTANVFDADFVGFELGNVNAANRASASIEVEDAKLEAGQTHTMVISGAELAGFQGTLELAAGLELVNVTYEGEGGLNLNGAANGVVTMMFLADATVSVAVRATEAGNLSDMVSLTSGVTVAEGVNLNGTAGPLSLEFTGATGVELVNGLEQNAPNPVADVTRIGFTLAQAGDVTLTIQDVAGRTVSVRELTGVAGRNVVELNVADLGGATGVLSYTLVAGDFSATKKMVVVR